MLKVWGLCCENCKWVEICCRLRFLSSLRVSGAIELAAKMWIYWAMWFLYSGKAAPLHFLWGERTEGLCAGVPVQVAQAGAWGSGLPFQELYSSCCNSRRAAEEQLSDLQCLHYWKKSIHIGTLVSHVRCFLPPGSVFSLPAASAFQHTAAHGQHQPQSPWPAGHILERCPFSFL